MGRSSLPRRRLGSQQLRQLHYTGVRWPGSTRSNAHVSLQRLFLLAVLALSGAAYLEAREACNFTVWDAIESRSAVLETVFRFEESSFNISGYLSDPSIVMTSLACKDSGIINTMIVLKGVDNSSAPLLVDVLQPNNTQFNSIALYNTLPGGAWDADHLANAGTHRTALSLQSGPDYDLSFTRSEDGYVVVSGLMPYNATIRESVEACNGYLHILDLLPIPAETLADVPKIDSAWDSEDIKVFCNTTSLLDTMLHDSVLAEHVEAAIELFPEFAELLDGPFRGSVFLPTKGATQSLYSEYGDEYASQVNATRLMLYSATPRPHCPSDFVEMRADKTMLGDLEGSYQPLAFKLMSDGRVHIYSPAPVATNATVLLVHASCEAEVYLYDGVISAAGLAPTGYEMPGTVEEHWAALHHPLHGGAGGAWGSFSPAPRCKYPVDRALLPDWYELLQEPRLEFEVAADPSAASEQEGEEAAEGALHKDDEGEDDGGVPVVAIAVPAVAVVLLLLAVVAVLGALLAKRYRDHHRWLRKPGGAIAMQRKRGPGSGPGGDDNDDVSSVATEDLVAAIATAGSFNHAAKSEAWKRSQALMYKRTAKALNAMPVSAPSSSMYPAGGSSSTANDSGGEGGTPSLTPATSGLGLALASAPAGFGLASAAPAAGGPSSPQREGWEIEASELEFCTDADGEMETLGRGSGGRVFKGIRAGIQDVAIKVLDRSASTSRASLDDKAFNQLRREIVLLKDLRDKNIVQFYGACVAEGEKIMLVTEYLPGGDLYHLLQDKSRAPDVRWSARGGHVALDIARGLAYLHSRKIVHLDLKSANILLSADGTAKIADMGLAQVLRPDGTLPEEHGTYAWAAPEMLMHMKLTEQADIYSFGVVLWELITQEEPKRGRLRTVRAPDECPQEIKDLLESCLQVIPSERPTAKQVFTTIKSLVKPSAPGRRTTSAAPHSAPLSQSTEVGSETCG